NGSSRRARGAHGGEPRPHGRGRARARHPRPASMGTSGLPAVRSRVPPAREDHRSVTPTVSVVIETSTWHEGGQIDLSDALAALCAQRYPQDRFEILVVVPPEHRQRWAALAPRFPRATIVEAPSGLSYYQTKGVGLRHAGGDIVTFVDADNWVGPEWIEEIVRPFTRAERIAAVLGPIRYRDAFLSRMWDALWWIGAYDSEGPVDRIYASNSIAFRRAALAEHYYDDPRRYRGFWERTLTARFRDAGYTLWLNPRARFT